MVSHTVVVTVFFFFNDTATTEIYTLSLHDALPISCGAPAFGQYRPSGPGGAHQPWALQVLEIEGGRIVGLSSFLDVGQDRKSTRLNSSHANISYAVFCLKKKNTTCTLLPYLSQYRS